MKRLKYFYCLIIFNSLVLYSNGQNINYVDSIKQLDSLGIFDNAVKIGNLTLGNIEDLNSIDAAWAYYFIATGYFMECLREIDYTNADSVNFFAEKSLKIVNNVSPKHILNSKNYYIKSGYYYIKGNLELSILYNKVTIQECDNINYFPFLYLTAYKQIGNAFGLLQNKDSSYYYYQKALKINKKYFKSEKDEADIYYQISLIIDLDFKIRIDAALNAKKMYDKLYGKFSFKATKINQSISNIYSSNKDYKSALAYSIQNTKIYDSLPGIYPEIIIQNDLNIIRNYRYMSKFDSAEFFFIIQSKDLKVQIVKIPCY